ncbi:lipopolysaccharide biosynthesis protein [Lysobacter sp. A3-1-A15]|uniref:lipopolysaccharide biosynthesis protein n=1 Tax=Novilysobacter viscosus TaxID=3098602 RepID=UPI002EDB4AAA
MLGWVAVFFLMAVAGTLLARRYALQRALVDEPGERRSHAVATPRGGGVAIVAVLLAACIALAFRHPGHLPWLGAFGIGLCLVAGVGWLDDHRPLSPWVRLGVHCVAAAVLMAPIALGADRPLLALIGFGLVVTLTNVWNFMDGINGLAASQAAIAGAALALVLGGPAAALGWALVAGCAGFLPFNFPSARIFLGDVGSGALGFAVGALLVLAGLPDPSLSPLLLLPLAPFLVDASLTLGRRVIRGEAWWTAHLQHAYQGWARHSGHSLVTVLYGAAAAGGAVVLLALAGTGTTAIFIAIFALAWYTSAAFAWVWLQKGSASRALQLEKDRSE